MKAGVSVPCGKDGVEFYLHAIIYIYANVSSFKNIRGGREGSTVTGQVLGQLWSYFYSLLGRSCLVSCTPYKMPCHVR
jgi:hypothetical protein